MIDASKLEELGACKSAVAAFRRAFGDRPAPPTVEAALSVAQQMDWDWAAARLLAPAAQRIYEEARARAFAEAYLSPENNR